MIETKFQIFKYTEADFRIKITSHLKNLKLHHPLTFITTCLLEKLKKLFDLKVFL